MTFAKGSRTSLVLAHSTPLSSEVFAECSKTSKCRMTMKIRDWCLPFIGNWVNQVPFRVIIWGKLTWTLIHSVSWPLNHLTPESFGIWWPFGVLQNTFTALLSFVCYVSKTYARVAQSKWVKAFEPRTSPKGERFAFEHLKTLWKQNHKLWK